MHKGARRVPWLDLLTEKKLHLCRVLFMDIGEYRIVESGEHFGGEGTDVVEVELDGYHISKSEFSFVDNKTCLGSKIGGTAVKLLLQRVSRLKKHSRTGRDNSEECLTVNGFWRDISGEGLAGELGSQCHLDEEPSR